MPRDLLAWRADIVHGSLAALWSTGDAAWGAVVCLGVGDGQGWLPHRHRAVGHWWFGEAAPQQAARLGVRVRSLDAATVTTVPITGFEPGSPLAPVIDTLAFTHLASQPAPRALVLADPDQAGALLAALPGEWLLGFSTVVCVEPASAYNSPAAAGALSEAGAALSADFEPQPMPPLLGGRVRLTLWQRDAARPSLRAQLAQRALEREQDQAALKAMAEHLMRAEGKLQLLSQWVLGTGAGTAAGGGATPANRGR